ncbi:MAG: hypothetical protein LBV50_11385 [Novosphingobium sp.]|nr:hypothetical protein [Novosphingobium sp.]
MHDENTIVRARQQAIRREMDRRGIAIKAVQFDGGWDTPSTVLSWFPADAQRTPATLSVAGLYRLLAHDALPAELLSLLLPAGFVIARVPEDVNHDEIAAAVLAWLDDKNRANRPDSPAGTEIAASEDRELCIRFRKIIDSGRGG